MKTHQLEPQTMTLFTPEEIAERNRMSKDAVWDLIKTRKIDHVFLSPKKARIPEGAFEKFVEKNLVRAQ